MPKSSAIDPEAACRLVSTTGRNGPFNHEQDAVVRSHLDAWYDFAFKENPGSGGRGKTGKLTKWKQDRAREIMKHDAFAQYPDGFDYKETYDAIVRKFTNYRNSRRKRIEELSSDKEAIKNAAATLMDLKAFSKGRDLFREEKHSEIAKRKTEILLCGDVTSSVGAYQRAVKELWEEADREEWEERAQTEGRNIYENQRRLPTAVFTGLRGLAQGGIMGNLEILFFYAHRDETGRVVSSLLEVHHDDSTEHFSTQGQAQGLHADTPGYQLAFETWADRVLPEARPQPAVPDSIQLKRTATGLPLFPKLNVDDETIGSLRRILQRYLEVVWEHGNPGDRSPPWAEIAEDPSKFYDTKLYPLPRSITDPSTLLNSETLDLVSSLDQFSQPFEFFPRVGENASQILDDDTLLKFPKDFQLPEDTPFSESAGDALSFSNVASASRQRFSPNQTSPLPPPSAPPPPPPPPAIIRSSPSAIHQPRAPAPETERSSTPPVAVLPALLSRHESVRTSRSRSPSAPAKHLSPPSADSVNPTAGLASLPVSHLSHPTPPTIQPSSRPSPPAVEPSSTSPPADDRSPTLQSVGATADATHTPALHLANQQAELARASATLPTSVAPLDASVDGAAQKENGACDVRCTRSNNGINLQPAPSSTASQHAQGATRSTEQRGARTKVIRAAPSNSRKRQKRSPVIDNTQTGSTSEKVGAGRRSQRTTARASAQPTLSSGMLVGQPVDATPAGRKRTFSEMKEETGVVLSDGRRGLFKPSKKHKGGWFYETAAEGESAVEKEWMNQDELEEMLQ